MVPKMHDEAPASPSIGAPFARRGLEMETQLSSERTRCDIVRAAEGGEEVVQRLLVRHIDGSEAQTLSVVITAKEVVVTHTDVK